MRKLFMVGCLSVFGVTAPDLVPGFPAVGRATAGPLESGTTNKADLPGMARMRMAQTWPAWRVESAVLRANGLSVAVVASNPRGERKAFSVYVVTRTERTRGLVYYVAEAVMQ